MRQRLSARTEQAIETWQIVAKELVREPVRDAVQEALADEEIHRRASPARSGDESADDGRSYLTPKVLLPLFGLAAAMLYARRRSGGLAGQGPSEEISAETDEAATTTAGGRTTRSEPSVAREAEPEAEAEDEHGSDAEETDEEATARS